MSITARRLNRTTLGRQLLLRREPLHHHRADRRRRRQARPQLLEFADRPRTKAEVEDLLAERLGDRQPRMWWALRTFAPLLHAPTGGRWSFGPRSSFVAAPVRLPPERRDEVGALAGPALPGGVRPGLGPGRRPVLPAQEAGGSRRPVGQHPARLRRPQPRDPTGLPPADHPPERRRPANAPGRRLRGRVWRPVEGGSKPWRSTSCPTRPGPAWPRRRPPWWRPGRPRTHGLPPLHPLVGRAAG
jgi:hypothetical protein